MEIMLLKGHNDENAFNCFYDFAEGIAYALAYAVPENEMDDVLVLELRDDIEVDFVNEHKERS